jgi:SAM-dependent methyltransferase
MPAMVFQRETIKKVLDSVPGAGALARWMLRAARTRRLRQQFGRQAQPEEIFTRYFEQNYWGSGESASGPGSTLDHTANIRRELPALMQSLDVKTFLDAPCGDYNWFKLIDRPGVRYIGGDIVKSLVQANQQRCGDERTSFVHLDITRDPLPDADIWLCRDALIHLSNRDLKRAISNFLGSDITYLLATSHTEIHLNSDIPTGGVRGVNLRLSPFHFPEPVLIIDDWIPGAIVRKLCLWKRDTLRQHFAHDSTYTCGLRAEA